jgi:TBC1 domain family member 10
MLPGVVFLFRVGLTLIHCCRHYLLQSDGEASALEYMVHPPASCLPITPEAFIALAYSFKLKDDDVRKQRIKMEAQVKRQTQMRVLSVPGLAVTKTGSAISLPKS